MQEATEIHVQRTKDEKEKSLPINEPFKVLYHASLIGGIILSILYFMFYGNALPSIGNISQLSSYLIAIFGVALIFIIYFIVTTISPSLVLFENNFIKEYYKNIIFQKILIALINIIIFNLIAYYNDIRFALMFASSFIFIFIFQLFLVKKYSYKWDILKSVPVWSSFISYSLLSIFFIALMLSPISSTPASFNMTILLISLLAQCLFTIPNAIFLHNMASFTNTSKASVRNVLRLLLLTTIVIISILSMAFSILKQPNKLITTPFSILKFGYYTAELHFKQEFIDKSNPFPLNDTNQTSNIFFILSSVGDEYIFCDINSTHEHNVSRMYRIKKENVEFEVVGKEIEAQSTVWKHNAKE